MQDVATELAALDRMSTGDLAERYRELYGRPCRTRHRQYLIRKVAWRIQANAEGDLSERARRRAAELADDAEIRVMAPKTLICPPQVGETVTVTRPMSTEGEKPNDPRMPPPGTALVRQYKGRTVRAVVLEDGQSVEWNGERFRSLSALANRITRNRPERDPLVVDAPQRTVELLDDRRCHLHDRSERYANADDLHH